MPFEIDRLTHKIKAGAKFVITQPVIGKDQNVDPVYHFNIPVVVEAWMSNNVDLLMKSVRSNKVKFGDGLNPVDNLKILHEAYPESCIYLSMLGFKRRWKTTLPRL